MDEAMRLDVAGRGALPAGVAQAQPPLIPAGGRDGGQQFGVHGVRPGQRDRGGVKGADPVPEPGRQQLLNFGQCPQ
jgi:hypothetical protein